jgi:hypothetical protein
MPPLIMLHERLTVPEYPLTGVSEIADMELCPAVTLPGFSALTTIV